MTVDGDALAGLCDQFGALTRSELRTAVEEVAFARGDPFDEAATGDAIDEAVATLRLVPLTRDGEELLAPGPAAFPTLPPGADDLPHVLDVAPRQVDRAVLVEPAERRLREAAARAVADGDAERTRTLLDATYELEAWAADADVGSVRERLDDALDG